VTDDLRFPVGRFDVRAPVAAEQIPGWIGQVADTPARLRAAVEGLSAEQLDTPYRPGGWTVRQLVHHLPDSHMNAYGRLKLALTEDEPTIKPYDESAWAELEDSRGTPPEVSLTLLEALHDRWVRLLRALGPEDFARTLRHPEMGVMRVDALTGLYAWHGRHHVAHVTGLRGRMGW
jgi:hypothetical protein